MPCHGFVRIAAACPQLRIADCTYNAERTIALLQDAEAQGVEVIVFPELGLTGYTCNDLFFQTTLRQGALDALKRVTEATSDTFSGVAIVGLPVSLQDQLFNVAAILQGGKVLGIVPKTYLPTYKEFYEARFFTSALTPHPDTIHLGGDHIPFGSDLLFTAAGDDGFTLGVEICEDLWVPIPPSSIQAIHGATILANLSASNETIGKESYRRQLVSSQSARCLAGYVYASAGIGESTTDLVFGGHALIAENGTILAESKRFATENDLLVSDLDIDRLRADRLRTTTFQEATRTPIGNSSFRRIALRKSQQLRERRLLRIIDARPFIPQGETQLQERCEEIFLTQTTGLGRRLHHVGIPPVAIGVSGGLDSTLALLVLCKTLDTLNIPRNHIRALTMPGFGTTTRTRTNAIALMQSLGVCHREIDIRPLCFAEMKLLGHDPFGISLAGLTLEQLLPRLQNLPAENRHDVTFENVQARQRTNLLMNTGFVIGTGDLSELALGWCTYQADHMSMYNPNVGIPKTLVKFLVQWAAQLQFDGEARKTLLDIVATEISPELLPHSNDGKAQSTESAIGPYELHDFFLFYFLRFGMSPRKILYLASHATFQHPYPPERLRHWLGVFLNRFFQSQYKRSCLPDGPKVGSVSLSPRGDWRMPSDAQVALWLEELS